MDIAQVVERLKGAVQVRCGPQPGLHSILSRPRDLTRTPAAALRIPLEPLVQQRLLTAESATAAL